MSNDISITAIRQEDVTTAELLKLLAKNDSIVFAEPNYITDMKSEEDDAMSDADEGFTEDSDEGDPSKEEITSDGDGSARDVTATQWSSSKDSTFRAAGNPGNVSMNVPGWPNDADSNMDHEIIVAIMDDAVDFSNPDLTDRAYTFSPEL